MIACKMECLNIIELISAYDNDVMVQFLAASFKGIEFPKKKINFNSFSDSENQMQFKYEPELVDSFLGTLPSEDTLQPIL